MKEKPASRTKERVLMMKEVVINGIIKANILDMSDGGMYVHTQAEFIKGAALELKFEIGRTPVTINAVVQHAEPGMGIGVRFKNLSPENARLIKKFIISSPLVPEIEGVATEKKILIVDDNAQSRLIHLNKLGTEGFIVTEASNGTDALKKMQANKPNLVILELWMEGMDGYKLMQLMQLNPELKSIPILILSSRCAPTDVQKAVALGAVDYLPKITTSPIKLTEKVKEILASVKR